MICATQVDVNPAGHVCLILLLFSGEAFLETASAGDFQPATTSISIDHTVIDNIWQVLDWLLGCEATVSGTGLRFQPGH